MWRTTDRLSGGVLKDLVMAIADQPDGFDVAAEIYCQCDYFQIPQSTGIMR